MDNLKMVTVDLRKEKVVTQQNADLYKELMEVLDQSVEEEQDIGMGRHYGRQDFGKVVDHILENYYLTKKIDK